MIRMSQTYLLPLEVDEENANVRGEGESVMSRPYLYPVKEGEKDDMCQPYLLPLEEGEEDDEGEGEGEPALPSPTGGG